MSDAAHYPPPYQDLATLARNICCGERTIETWVQQGVFPKPRLQGGKRLWRWAEVDAFLGDKGDAVSPVEAAAQRIKDATAKALRKSNRIE